jgi:hypothetical protein
MVSLLEEFANSERQLLIIAEDIKGDALDALVMNKERGSLKVYIYMQCDWGMVGGWVDGWVDQPACAPVGLLRLRRRRPKRGG